MTNYNKQFLFCLFFLFCCSVTMAQTPATPATVPHCVAQTPCAHCGVIHPATQGYVQPQYLVSPQKQQRIMARQEIIRNFKPSNEIALSYSPLSMVINYYTSDYYYDHISSNMYYNNDDLSTNYENLLYYRGKSTTTDVFSFRYRRNIYHWLSIGFNATYVGEYATTLARSNDKQIGTENTTNIMLMPSFKFTYFNRNIVKLYSAISIGVWLGINEATGVNANNNYANNTQVQFAAHLTYIGVEVGKDLFGFAELGVGTEGLATVGIGYKF